MDIKPDVKEIVSERANNQISKVQNESVPKIELSTDSEDSLDIKPDVTSLLTNPDLTVSVSQTNMAVVDEIQKNIGLSTCDRVETNTDSTGVTDLQKNKHSEIAQTSEAQWIILVTSEAPKTLSTETIPSISTSGMAPATLSSTETPINSGITSQNSLRLNTATFSASADLTIPSVAASSIAQQNPLIAQQNQSIAQQNPSIAQQNPLVAQQNPLIAQPSIAQQNPLIAQSNPLIVQSNPLIAQQNPSLALNTSNFPISSVTAGLPNSNLSVASTPDNQWIILVSSTANETSGITTLSSVTSAAQQSLFASISNANTLGTSLLSHTEGFQNIFSSSVAQDMLNTNVTSANSFENPAISLLPDSLQNLFAVGGSHAVLEPKLPVSSVGPDWILLVSSTASDTSGTQTLSSVVPSKRNVENISSKMCQDSNVTFTSQAVSTITSSGTFSHVPVSSVVSSLVCSQPVTPITYESKKIVHINEVDHIKPAGIEEVHRSSSGEKNSINQGISIIYLKI